MSDILFITISRHTTIQRIKEYLYTIIPFNQPKRMRILRLEHASIFLDTIIYTLPKNISAKTIGAPTFLKFPPVVIFPIFLTPITSNC